MIEAVTISEMTDRCKAERERILRKGVWGTWKHIKRRNVLVCSVSGYGYEIDIDDLKTPAAVLDWIFQVRQKQWCVPTVMSDLLEAIYYLVDPQANLCSGGTERATIKGSG